MNSLAVCSFYVNRRTEYPDAVDYMPLLQALNRSCERLNVAHVVLTDKTTAIKVDDAELAFFASDLPRNLTKATTEAQACWLEENPWPGADTLFVGADCLVLKEFRDVLPPADLSIAFRPNDKRHRINNGFMFVPAESRAKVASLFRRIADATGPNMCDDMVAVEEALGPMPLFGCGSYARDGLLINFLPIDVWNGAPNTLDDACADSYVLHFRGKHRKTIMVDWAKRWLA